MKVSEKSLVSTCSVIVSLFFYYEARRNGKDTTPAVIVGGYLGGWIGEGIHQLIQK